MRQPVSLPTSQATPISLVLINTYYSFLVSEASPVKFLGRDLLHQLSAILQCNGKGVFIPLASDQTSHFLFSLIETRPLKRMQPQVIFQLLPVTDVPVSLWASYANEVALLQSTETVHVAWKRNKPFQPIAQCPLVSICRTRNWIYTRLCYSRVSINFTFSHYNTPVLPVKMRREVWFWWEPNLPILQDLIATILVVPHHPTVPITTTVCTPVPAYAGWFAWMDLCSAVFSILLHPDSQFLSAVLFRGQWAWPAYLRNIVAPPSMFSQVLKACSDL